MGEIVPGDPNDVANDLFARISDGEVEKVDEEEFVIHCIRDDQLGDNIIKIYNKIIGLNFLINFLITFLDVIIYW